MFHQKQSFIITVDQTTFRGIIDRKWDVFLFLGEFPDRLTFFYYLAHFAYLNDFLNPHLFRPSCL